MNNILKSLALLIFFNILIYAVTSESDKWLGNTNVYRKTGNVGINTTTPTERLEVNGTIKATGLNVTTSTISDVTVSTITGNTSLLFQGTNINFSTATNKSGLSSMYIDEGGYVGIGNTSPSYGLDVISSIGIHLGLTASDGLYILPNVNIQGGNSNTISGNYSYVGNGQANDLTGNYSYIGNGYDIDIQNSNFSFVGGGRSGGIGTNEHYSFIGGGENVHIGNNGSHNTINGGYYTDIGDYVNYSNVIGGENVNISNYSDHSTMLGGYNITASSHNICAWGVMENEVNCSQPNTFIILSGDVGISTTTPSEKLHVVGNIKSDYGVIASTFQMTTGAGAGKVLTSDASGYASWSISVNVDSATYAVNSGTAVFSNNTDTVDGQHATYFTTPSNMSSGSFGANVIASSIAVNSIGKEQVQSNANFTHSDSTQTWTGQNNFNNRIYTSSSVIADAFETTRSAANAGEMKLFELSGNGDNYISLKSSASLAGDLPFTLPPADGTSGQALLTNGNKDLYFATVSSVAIASVGINQLQTNIITTYDYAVAVSSPYSLGTNAICISPFRSYAVTITTITAISGSATNTVFMIEQRPDSAPNSAGTDIWTGDITVGTTFTGISASDFTVPANSALYLVPTSVSGDVTTLTIKYTITKD